MKTAIAGVILGLLAIPAAMAQASGPYPVEGQGYTRTLAQQAMVSQAQNLCGITQTMTITNVQIFLPLVYGDNLYTVRGQVYCGDGGPGGLQPVIPGIGLH